MIELVYLLLGASMSQKMHNRKEFFSEHLGIIISFNISYELKPADCLTLLYNFVDMGSSLAVILDRARVQPHSLWPNIHVRWI